MNRRVDIIGGGTISYIRTHLALCAPAYGATARRLASLCEERFTQMDTVLHLTKMANRTSNLETTDDLQHLADALVADPLTKVVFFNAAVCDFNGTIEGVEPGRLMSRLSSAETQYATLWPAAKILNSFRKDARKDIFLVGTKATAGASPREQYTQGLRVLKQSSSNLVLANDVVTRNNMIIVPEEAAYHETTNREEALKQLVDMAYLRSHLTFTRSIVVDGVMIPWESPLVPRVLRQVIDYCIARGAYRRFLGATAGHFAVRLSDTEFLTSRRKTDFNDMKSVGLVHVRTNGPDSVLAFGSKPSVGGQSQRIVFQQHEGMDCIVHFHCPIRPGSQVPVVSQREFECGSHECGQNTSAHLKQFGNLRAVYLDQHGPNIVFRKDADPMEIIEFIYTNFDLEQKTGGYQL